MIDFNILHGLSTELFSAPGVVNPDLIIEEGCWYLCTDTAELYLGVRNAETSEYALKQINQAEETIDSTIIELLNVEINKVKESLSDYATKTDIEDFATEEFVNKKIAEAELADKEVDLEAYYTKSEVDALIPDTTGFIKEIPSEYITEEELTAKGYLTEHQDLSNYALKSDIPTDYLKDIPAEYVTESELTAKGYITDISGKADAEHKHTLSDITDYSAPDLSEYAKRSELPDVAGFIKEIPAEYVTEAELEAKGYITAHQDLSEYAKKSDIPTDYIKAIPDEYITESELAEELAKIEHPTADLKGYATETWVAEQGFLKSVPDEFITADELANEGFLKEHQSLDNYALKSDLDGKANVEHTHESYAAKEHTHTEYSLVAHEHSEYLTEQSLEGYATEQYVIDAIANQVPVESLAKKEEIVEVKTKLENEVLPTIQETILPVVEKAATQEWVKEQGYLTEHQSLEGLATENFVKNAIAEAELGDKDADLSGYATKDDIKDFASTSYVDEKFGSIEISEVPTKVSELENDLRYVKAVHLSTIENYPLRPSERHLIENIALIRCLNMIRQGEALALTWSSSNSMLEYESYGDHFEYVTLREVQYGPIGVTDEIRQFTRLECRYYYDNKDWYLISSGDQSVELYAPTKVSELENDRGYITVADVPKTDLSGYYNKAETESLVSEAVKNIEHPTVSFDGYATEDFVRTEIGKIDVPTVDTSNLVTTETFTSVLATKANEVPFTTDKFVTNFIGSFTKDDCNLKGLTVAQIFAKLLGLTDESGEEPEEPDISQEITIEVVKKNSIPIMQGSVNTSDGSTKIEDSSSIYDYLELTEENRSAAPKEADPSTSVVYEIKNAAGNVIEHGYQVYTIASGRGSYWRVSIPAGLVIKEVQMYDAGQSQWVEYTPTFTDTGETLTANGYTYIIYQSSDRANEEVLRFVIE